MPHGCTFKNVSCMAAVISNRCQEFQFVQTFLFFCFSIPGRLMAWTSSAYCLFPPSLSSNTPSGSPFLFPFIKSLPPPRRFFACQFFFTLPSLSFLFVFPFCSIISSSLLSFLFLSHFLSFLLASASIISPSSFLLLAPRLRPSLPLLISLCVTIHLTHTYTPTHTHTQLRPSSVSL